METDFLNFHDGEHFSVLDSPDFQERSNSLLDDYCSHFSFSRHSSDDFIESTSSFWEQDEEQELNGDIAVIPVSGQINREIPHLSSSPDCKDDFIIDWHHFVAIENNTDKDDSISHQHYEKSPTTDKQLGKINAETAQQNQIENNLSDNCKNLSNPNNLNYDQVIRNNIKQEYHNENRISPKKSLSDKETDTLFKDIDTEKIGPLGIHTEIFIKSENIDDLNLDSANDILFDKDFLNCKKTNLVYDSDSIRNIKEDFHSEKQKLSNELFIKSEILPDLNLDSAANELLLNSSFDKLDLITAVAKDDIELDLSIDSDKLEDLHQPDFDKDDFDLTTYLNDDDSEPIAPIITPSENIIPKSEPIPIKNVTPPKVDLVDTDDDCIDVETVSPSGCRPVLEAKDVTSLLEQFEANEAVNVSIHDDNISNKNVKKLPEVRKSTISYSKRKVLSMEDIDEKKNKVVDRIKANVKRKSVPVIEPIPNVKNNNKIIDHDKKIMQKKVKSTKVVNQTEKESYHLDHDYCSIGGPKQNQKEGIDYYKVLRRQDINCGQGIGNKGIRCIETTTNNPKIEDTAIRIAEKTKPQIIPGKKIQIAATTPTTPQQKNNSLLKSTDNIRMQNSPKSVLLKNNANSLLKTSNYKNVDGKLMVSVLKTNQKMKNTLNPTKMAVIETKTPHDQCIQNIIVDSDNLRPKKRKLNLEEYKKRREINKTRSCDNSRTNSPVNITSGSSSPLVNHGSFSLPVTAVGSPAQPSTPSEKEVKKLTHEEMLLKMAADLLTTTPMKTTEQKAYTIEPFTPPGAEVSPSVPQQPMETIPAVVLPKPCDDNIEMITIVSIGVNTDISLINELKPQPAPKIQFQIKKKPEISRINKLSPPKTTVSKQLVEQLNLDADEKLTEIITPILQNANSSKINSNSLISNITATILQKKRSSINSSSPRSSDQDRKSLTTATSDANENQNEVFEHGEDKTVIILDKNRVKPKTASIEIQTEHYEIKDDLKNDNRNKKSLPSDDKVEVNKVKVKRQYRVRRDSYSSESSVDTTSSKKSKSRKSYKPSSSGTSRSLSTSISSIDSSNCSRSSRSRSKSRSRSRSRSYSRSLSRSSYSSSSSRSSRSRSRSRSRSHHRYDSASSRSSRDKYSRSRRRSRSNHSYRSYNRSRSPLKRSNDRKSRSSWEQMDPEKLRQVEERRVIYVGRLLPGTTKNDLKRRFSKFGPIIETSVHFRDKGDNYGFVTFQYKSDAYEAIERGNEDPNLPQYDISFGGRRVFCQTRYADLDNTEAIEMNCYNRNIQEDSFDILLKEAQAKLRKRKV